jgi:hypothetical protein
MNITDEHRRLGAIRARKNRDMIPTGGFIDPKKASQEYERRLNGQCFCPRRSNGAKRHNPNCMHYQKLVVDT